MKIWFWTGAQWLVRTGETCSRQPRAGSKSEQGKSNLGSRKPKTTAKITLYAQNKSASKAKQQPRLKKTEFDK
jgi:hypothetical protein